MENSSRPPDPIDLKVWRTFLPRRPAAARTLDKLVILQRDTSRCWILHKSRLMSKTGDGEMDHSPN